MMLIQIRLSRDLNLPRFANSLAVTFPMPVFAPVTTIVLPARDTDSIVTQTTACDDRFLQQNI